MQRMNINFIGSEHMQKTKKNLNPNFMKFFCCRLYTFLKAALVHLVYTYEGRFFKSTEW